MQYSKNDIITNDFVILEIKPHGKRLELTLSKDDAKINGLLRDNIDLFRHVYNIGDHVVVKAKVKERNKEPYLEIVQVRKYDLNQSRDEIKKQVDDNILKSKLSKLIESVKDEEYHQLLLNFFENEEICQMFYLTPGGRKNHHNYEFGLLHHTIETTEIALMIGDYFRNYDRDLLCAGCLLHDVGKIRCYEYLKNEYSKTDWDNLLGHLSISAIFISKMIPEKFDVDKAMKLYHLILSHHGRPVYGSPIEVKMKEAFILHEADVLSSQLNHIEKLNFVNQKCFDELTNRLWFKGD